MTAYSKSKLLHPCIKTCLSIEICKHCIDLGIAHSPSLAKTLSLKTLPSTVTSPLSAHHSPEAEKSSLDFFKHHSRPCFTVILLFSLNQNCSFHTRSVVNKLFTLSDFLILDVLYVTQTWHTSGDLNTLVKFSLSDCTFFSALRTGIWGGGLAIIFKYCFKCRLLTVIEYSKFKWRCPALC